MTTFALSAHNPDAALPSLTPQFTFTPGAPSQALAKRTAAVREHFAAVMCSTSSIWMTIFERGFPTFAHELGDPDLPAYRVDRVTTGELASLPNLGMTTRAVRLPPPTD